MSTASKTYKVAIIIPTLNEEKFIGSCLQSVINQSFPFSDMDVMIVDGGSKDSTRDIVTELAQQHSNIRLLSNDKRIQSIAFNIGVANSSAPYIVRLDAHATYDAHYIELCIKHLEAHPEFGNVGGIWDIRPQNSSYIAKANAILNQSKFGTGGAQFRTGATKEGEVDTVPFGAFPRSVIEKVGGMNETLARGEDNEYNNRIRKAGYKIFLDPKIIAIYYSRPSFVTSIKQMYENGRSIGKLVHLDASSVSVRHLIPMLFTISILVGILGSFFYAIFALFLAVVGGTYMLANIIATCILCHSYGYKYFPILPPLFLSVHIMYGLGTIIGLITNK